MEELKTDLITKNLMQFCYTCDDAAHCTTEEICRHCWADRGIPVDQKDQEEKTEEINDICKMINNYHE